jgi:hypothetical protein
VTENNSGINENYTFLIAKEFDIFDSNKIKHISTVNFGYDFNLTCLLVFFVMQ